jgi:pantoate--beta-alanine ligase
VLAEAHGAPAPGKQGADTVVVNVDYLTLVDPDGLEPVEPGYRGIALLAVAARVGRTRLIDNTLVRLAPTTGPSTPGGE